MKCEKCGKDFPSRDYFKTENICNSCYENSHTPAGIAKDTTQDNQRHTKSIKLSGIFERIITFVIVVQIILVLFSLIAFFHVMIDPDSHDLYSFKDYGILYRLSPINEVHNLPGQDLKTNMAISDVKITYLADLNFVTNNRWLIFLRWVMRFFVIGLSLYLLSLVKDILRTVKEKNPFDLENTSRIRKIGFIIIFANVLWIISGILLAFYFQDPVSIPGFKISLYNQTINGFISEGVTGIFIGLVILIIAEIFKIGALYREEVELTV